MNLLATAEADSSLAMIEIFLGIVYAPKTKNTREMESATMIRSLKPTSFLRSWEAQFNPFVAVSLEDDTWKHSGIIGGIWPYQEKSPAAMRIQTENQHESILIGFVPESLHLGRDTNYAEVTPSTL